MKSLFLVHIIVQSWCSWSVGPLSAKPSTHPCLASAIFTNIFRIMCVCGVGYEDKPVSHKGECSGEASLSPEPLLAAAPILLPHS